ncbi:GDSL-type esterase/lipase family protein [Conexibacter sp. CPCC 206217]|uniref:SGNH/GDSL hydrolase family protein n=1 Tax=Conexibacter sp. CPCC 206217 TaxID=3064574 RepID=UPI0027209916|nr:GDSL-type esterase/lipase family protein [Conexibacter sp. CPCC 206217]MDO8213069.1 GDSL-type esterase/lipase family protein [Conexibacter sp. CPCC 206217]
MSDAVAASVGDADRPGAASASAAGRPAAHAARDASAAALRRGLVALGDSITNGRGEPWLGVPALSWAQWVAEALELPFTKLARDGARAEDVLRDLAPRLAGPYDVAALYVGVNDARSLDWDAAAYERSLTALAQAAGASLVAPADRAAPGRANAGRLLLLTPPADLGRPTCAPKSLEAAAIVRRVAGEQGALVVALDDLAGRRFVLPDTVHPTALGQVEIAARAINVLAAAGRPPRHDVWESADRHRSRRAARAADRRWLTLLAQDLRRRAVERLAR